MNSTNSFTSHNASTTPCRQKTGSVRVILSGRGSAPLRSQMVHAVRRSRGTVAVNIWFDEGICDCRRQQHAAPMLRSKASRRVPGAARATPHPEQVLRQFAWIHRGALGRKADTRRIMALGDCSSTAWWPSAERPRP